MTLDGHLAARGVDKRGCPAPQSAWPLRPLFSHVLYSDDHGADWRTGGVVPTEGFDECQLAELRDGRIRMNARHATPAGRSRGTAVSDDGGLSGSPMRYEPARGAGSTISTWSPGAKVVKHSRYVIFQLAEVAVPRELFAAILGRIQRLAPVPT